MTPLDDELRSMFSARADVLTPAPDPLAGIERRAKRMRRNRAAASVAGAALAVSALAVVVPTFLPDPGRTGVVPATQPPSPSPFFNPGALDPQNPWEYRGDRGVLGNGTLETIQREWALRHPGSTVKPLYGQVYEPSGQAEIVFVATAQGSDRWGVATASEAGPDFLVDEALPDGTKVLMAALPGDEVSRLLVLAAPSTGQISYAAGGASYQDYAGPVPGVAFFALDRATSRDLVRVLDGNGDLDNPVYEGLVPEATSSDGPAAPANVVSWPARGVTPKPDFLEEALTAFARGLGTMRPDVMGKVLFYGDDDAGNRFLFGQAWIKGNDAHTFGYSVNGRGEATPFLGPVTAEGPAVLAFVVPAGTGQSRDTLVVIPAPAAKQTFYGPPASEYDEITGQEHLGGVSLIDRLPDQDGKDMLKLLGANGSEIFEGPIGPLLCGVKECG